jgi:tetratricopeptide (TPR) repeat protein
VIGMDGWDLEAGGVPPPILERAHQMREQSGKPTVMSERKFAVTIGRPELLSRNAQEYTPAQLGRILDIGPEQLRRWFRRGLLKPSRIVNRLPWFDFAGLSYARKLKTFSDAGVPLARVEAALKELTAWFPPEESGLDQLEPMFATPVIRLPDGSRAELSGQLLLDLEANSMGAATGGPPGRPTSRPAGGPSGRPMGGQAEQRAAGATRERIVPFRLETPGWAAPGRPAGTDGWVHRHSDEEWFTIGVEAEDDGNLTAACDAYQNALLAGGPDEETSFNLGNVLFRLGRQAEAVQRYLQAVEIQPAYVEAWNNLGIALGALGRLEESLGALGRAVALEPHYGDAHYNLADTLEQAGRPAEAREHWLAYLREDPDSELARKVRRRIKA